MPFREATALISVEREGILETWVRKISGSGPVIELPVEGRHAPNVFVSVLAVRGPDRRGPADRPGRSGQAGLPARHCRDPGGLART